MPHVPHLYLPPPWPARSIPLGEGHLHHLIRVLRVGKGQDVSYTDGQGVIGQGRLVDDTVERGAEKSTERPSEVTMAVAPPASRSRARFLVEKLAELGVGRLVWVQTEFTQGRAPAPPKAESWAVAGLQQSRGAWLTEIATGTIDDLPRPLGVADPDGGTWPPEIASVLIGPEGGFDPAEIPADGHRISLGPTVLRVETAALVAAARSRR